MTSQPSPQNPAALSFDFTSLAAAYRSGLSPSAVIGEVYRRIRNSRDQHVWTSLLPEKAALEQARRTEAAARDGQPLALFGLPFGVKDNIDVAGLPTSAGCASFTYEATRTADLVRRLQDAGAILVGKQNMDQFATGLVGIRSPGGYCRNAFDPDYIPGGSSSGSAVAVASGHVSFSIGSDTGGSGRVPAALNNIVGLKPTPGLVSTEGFLYCNRSFDVAPVFALTTEDAYSILEVIEGPASRDALGGGCIGPAHAVKPERAPALPAAFRIGVPAADQLEFFEDEQARQRFRIALEQLQALGAQVLEIDFTPFLQAGRLVFNSAFIAERWITYGQAARPEDPHIHPAVAQAIQAAQGYSAADAFEAQYRLQGYQRQVAAMFEQIDILVTPTAGTIYRCDAVEADPIALNANMGYYTYFANPLRLSAISVPAGLREDGLPFGVCLLGRSFAEQQLRPVARALQEALGGRLGATGHHHPALEENLA